MNHIPAPRRQAGMTLLEFSLAIGLAMTMAGLVGGMYVTSQRSQSMDTLRTQLMQVAAAASQMAENGQRGQITEANIAGSGLVPDGMVRVVSGVTTLGNAVGGTFTVAEDDLSDSVAARAMAITVNGLDAMRCTDLVMTSADRFDEIRVGSDTVKHGLAATVVAPDRATVAEACEDDPDATFLFVQ